MHSSIWETYSGVVVLHRSMVEVEEGVYVCAFFYMQNIFGVVVLQRSKVA